MSDTLVQINHKMIDIYHLSIKIISNIDPFYHTEKTKEKNIAKMLLSIFTSNFFLCQSINKIIFVVEYEKKITV
jgi:hypothetical protein